MNIMSKIILTSCVACLSLQAATMEQIVEQHDDTINTLIDRKAEKSEIVGLKKEIKKLSNIVAKYNSTQKDNNKKHKNYSSKYQSKFNDYIKKK